MEKGPRLGSGSPRRMRQFSMPWSGPQAPVRLSKCCHTPSRRLGRLGLNGGHASSWRLVRLTRVFIAQTLHIGVLIRGIVITLECGMLTRPFRVCTMTIPPHVLSAGLSRMLQRVRRRGHRHTRLNHGFWTLLLTHHCTMTIVLSACLSRMSLELGGLGTGIQSIKS